MLGAAALSLVPFEECDDRSGVAPLNRSIQQTLSNFTRQSVVPQEPLVPAGVSVNFAISRDCLFDLLVKPVSCLFCQSSLQLSVLLFKVLNGRREGMGRSPLREVHKL